MAGIPTESLILAFSTECRDKLSNVEVNYGTEDSSKAIPEVGEQRKSGLVERPADRHPSRYHSR